MNEQKRCLFNYNLTLLSGGIYNNSLLWVMSCIGEISVRMTAVNCNDAINRVSDFD
jgi:hypothetical protein